MKKRSNIRPCLFITGILLLLLITGCEKGNDNITVTDIDGNVYNAVTIGTQVWMASNLKTLRYNDGAMISNAPAASGSYFFYNNNPDNKITYGALYNWYAVNTGKLCPTGWHIPTDDEWTILTDFLGIDVAGGKLKEKGTTHWNAPNEGATNETGFTALPGGLRAYFDGAYYTMGDVGNWWSSTAESTTHAWRRAMSYDGTNVSPSYQRKENGFSVRCIKD